MRITLEDSHGNKVSVENQKDDLKAREVLQLAQRAMLALGFTEEAIGQYLLDTDDTADQTPKRV